MAFLQLEPCMSRLEIYITQAMRFVWEGGWARHGCCNNLDVGVVAVSPVPGIIARCLNDPSSASVEAGD